MRRRVPSLAWCSAPGEAGRGKVILASVTMSSQDSVPLCEFGCHFHGS